MTLADTKRGLDYAISWHGRMRDFNVLIFFKYLPRLFFLIFFQTTNVVLIEGTQDPYHMLGIYKEEWARPGQKVVVMKGKYNNY